MLAPVRGRHRTQPRGARASSALPGQISRRSPPRRRQHRPRDLECPTTPTAQHPGCLAEHLPPRPRVSSTQLFPAVPRAVSGRPPLAWAGGRAGCFHLCDHCGVPCRPPSLWMPAGPRRPARFAAFCSLRLGQEKGGGMIVERAFLMSASQSVVAKKYSGVRWQ